MYAPIKKIEITLSFGCFLVVTKEVTKGKKWTQRAYKNAS